MSMHGSGLLCNSQSRDVCTHLPVNVAKYTITLQRNIYLKLFNELQRNNKYHILVIA